MNDTILHFIVVYDGAAGRLIRLEELGAETDAALDRYFALEREHADGSVQVVMLSARDRAALEVTHSHYFNDDASRLLSPGGAA